MSMITLIFKPVYACNLACRYCYNESWRDAQTERMSLSEAKILFKWLRDYCLYRGASELRVIWHGGEPLLMGESFFAEVIDYYERLFSASGIKCENSIQTNATLISDGYIRIFREHFNSKIGFSFDFQSNCRCFSNGEDASKLILDKVLYAKEHDIRVGAIMVCNHNNVGHMNEVFDYMASNDIPFKFTRPFSPLNPSKDVRSYLQTVTDEEYARCVCDLIDISLWQAKRELACLCTTVNEFVSSYLLNRAMVCTQSRNCFNRYLSAGPHGDLYTCGRYSDVRFKVGDFMKDSPAQVQMGIEKFVKNSDRHQKNCASCRFNSICQGGCTFLRMLGVQDSECKVNSIIWSHVSEVLTHLGLKCGDLKKCSRAESSKLIHQVLH